MIELARECIQQHRDFSVETTLAGGNVVRLMQQARDEGFKITMFYVGLGDYQLNIERVAARVKNGGHDIPTPDIIRRHSTSVLNLIANLHLIDHLILIDNTDTTGEAVLEVEGDLVKYQRNPLPLWVENIKGHL